MYNYVKGETDTIGFGRNYLLVDLSQVTPPGDHLQLIFVHICLNILDRRTFTGRPHCSPSRIVVPVYRDSDSGLNISSEPGSIIIPSSIIRGVVKSGVKYVK